MEKKLIKDLELKVSFNDKKINIKTLNERLDFLKGLPLQAEFDNPQNHLLEISFAERQEPHKPETYIYPTTESIKYSGIEKIEDCKISFAHNYICIIKQQPHREEKYVFFSKKRD